MEASVHISCTSVGTFYCRPKNQEGSVVSVNNGHSSKCLCGTGKSLLWLTLPVYEFLIVRKPSLQKHLLSFPEGLTGHPAWVRRLCHWCGGGKGIPEDGLCGNDAVCVISHQDTHGIQCSSTDKMNKQLGSLERRHCVITALISV